MPSLKLWKYPWKWNTVMHCSPFCPWHGCTQHSSGLLLLWNQPDHQVGRERLLRLLECLTELCYLRYCVLNLKMFYMVWSPSAKAKGQAHHRKSMLMVAYPKTSVFKPIQPCIFPLTFRNLLETVKNIFYFSQFRSNESIGISSMASQDYALPVFVYTWLGCRRSLYYFSLLEAFAGTT